MRYEDPYMEIFEFEAADVVTLSNPDQTGTGTGSGELGTGNDYNLGLGQ